MVLIKSLLGTKEQSANWESSNPKPIWISEAWHYRMAYKVKKRKLFNFYNEFFNNEGFLDSRELVKSEYLTPLQENDSSFFYNYQRHL